MKIQLLDLFDIKPTFDNFIANSNQHVCDSLMHSNIQFTHIIGSELSGKTHLLKAWINYQLRHNNTAIFLDEQCLDIDKIRTSFQIATVIALDNVDKFNEDQQIATFDLFNAIKLNNFNNCLVTSSTHNLEHTSNIRNDLKTRLLSGLNISLKAPSDEELLNTLEQYCHQSGISVSSHELNYVINHLPRNIGLLINTIDKIATQALSKNRHITIPFIKDCIEVLQAPSYKRAT